MKKLVLGSSHAAFLLHDKLTGLDHEELWVLYMTQRDTLIGMEMLTKGTLKSTLLDIRGIIKHSILNNAVKIIIAHNHPSGDPRPSPCDIRKTRDVQSACMLMDITLEDHIILADEDFYSFSEEKTKRYIDFVY